NNEALGKLRPQPSDFSEIRDYLLLGADRLDMAVPDYEMTYSSFIAHLNHAQFQANGNACGPSDVGAAIGSLFGPAGQAIGAVIGGMVANDKREQELLSHRD